MISQSVWIGIAIGVFFVGIGVSYAIFGINEPVQITDQEHIKTMIYDPEIHDAMMKIMMEDEEHARQMFKDMTTTPMQKHQFTQKMIELMETDSDFSTHIMAHMMENEEFVEEMLIVITQHAQTNQTNHNPRDIDVMARGQN